MTNPLILCAFAALPSAVAAQALNAIPFDDAVAKGLIEYEATKSYARNGLELLVHNRAGHPLVVHVPVGQIFEAAPEFQPQVVTRSKEVVLAADERYRFGLNALCGNAQLAAATPGTPFDWSGALPAEGTAILEALEEEALDGLSIVQRIVWMFTNNRPLADLHPGDLDPRTYHFILDVVQTELGNRVPDLGYRVAYEELDGGRRFSGIPLEVLGTVPFTEPSEAPLAIHLTSPSGTILRTGAVHVPPFVGVEAFAFTLDVSGFEQGDYLVRVTELANPSVVRGELAVEL